MDNGLKPDLEAVVRGILDVQFMMLLQIRAQLDLKHSDLIARLETTGRMIEKQGGSEHYVASRRMAVDSLLAAMRHIASLVNAQGEIDPSSARPALAVILGGLAGGDGNTPESVPEK